MGGQPCPNCKKGMMTRKGKHNTKVRCSQCGYSKFRSPNESGRGSMIGATRVPEKQIQEVKKIREEKLRRKEDGPKIPYPLNSEEYKQEKAMRDQYIRDMRKSMGIQKLIKKLKKDKYSGLKEITMEGHVFKFDEEEENKEPAEVNVYEPEVSDDV